MKRVLVLGGGGFLGSHVCKELIKKKYIVTVFQRSNLINKTSNIKFKSIDLTNKEQCLKYIKNFDYVINCAAILNSKNQKKNFLDNFKSFFYPYIGCIKNNIKNYIFISSNNAVSDKFFIKKNKANKTYQIKNGYTLAKIFSEYCGMELSKKNKVIFKVIRPSNIYGPGQSSGAIFYILKKLKNFNKKALSLNINPNSVRNYTYVNDCARCIVQLLKIKKNITCNITNDKKISMRNIVDCYAKILDKKIFVKYSKKKKISKKIFNITNLNKYIKWNDKYDIFQGIKEFSSHI
tara:strand:+ start:1648 stop:2523 length:876 start_codon:yes stop_codon:yes gene_type:complete